jgi:diketogulonate reductase-like aldo/keto reductase
VSPPGDRKGLNFMSIPSLSLPSGGAIPLLGFGTWQIRGGDAYTSVRLALDAGYRHLDTATMYGNEQQVGRALRDSGVPRDDVFVTTKLPPDRVGREHATLDASRRALGVDAVDLWLIHWPPAAGRSVGMWRELLAARDRGQARAVGVSNYGLDQIDELTKETGQTPEVNQIRWGPTLYDASVLAAHRDRAVVLQGYSPFRTTNLTDPVLTGIAEAHGVDAARVVLRWHLQHAVVVIPKSVTPDRITNNVAVSDFVLTDADMAAVDALAGP